MARPTTKQDLLEASQKGYEKLSKLLEKVPVDHLNDTFTFDVSHEKQAHWTRDENLKDVIVHLVEWHHLLLNWITTNMNGEDTQFLRDGYNWRTYGDMNQVIKEEHEHTTLEESLASLADSHQQIMDMIENFDNEQLFSKDVFPWVGGSTLGSYFVSASSSHYDWATKKVNKFIKSL